MTRCDADDSRGEGVDDEVIGSKGIGGGRSVLVGGKGSISRPTVTPASRAPTPAGFTTTPSPNGAELATRLIKEALNRSYAPCDDFYSFVCSTFSGGQDVLTKMGTRIKEAITHMLATMHIPPRFQGATEKAAGLYRACVDLTSDIRRSEVAAVKAFLSKLRLDISNIDHDPNFNILHRLVYLSFVYGFPAFVRFSATLGLSPDQIIDMAVNKEDENWMKTYHKENSGWNLNFITYTNYLATYDRNLDAAPIVKRIIRAELVVMEFFRTLGKRAFLFVYASVGTLGSFTKGYASNDDWVRLIEQATSNKFKAKNIILLRDNVTALVVLLLDRKQMSRDDSRLLISWSLVRQLLPLADSQMMKSESLKRFPNQRDRIKRLCYENVVGVMPLAVSRRYFSSYLPPSALASVSRVVADVKQALMEKLNKTEWIQGPMWCMMYEKAQQTRVTVAYPEAVSTESLIEDFYLDVPDIGGNFTAPYLTARRVSTLDAFRRDFNVSFDTANVNAYYSPRGKRVRIMGGLLQPPVFILGAPAAFNYGSIGQIGGHELMHAFDVGGMTLNAWIRLVNLENTTAKQLYTSKVLCLRASYNQAESESRDRTLDSRTDSEGFVDFVGIQIAYAAYRSLPVAERRETLPGVDLTAEQIFFVSHCLKWCSSVPGTKRAPGGLYWHSRSRCIVPLRNMAQFAEAFSCKRGDPMNPVKKCSFF
ncbi:neprilysin-1-like [Amblyomma americanum]